MSALSATDAALAALLLPFGSGALQFPAEGTLFLRARGGATLAARSIPRLRCVQGFRPDAALLQHAGLDVRPEADATDAGFALVLALPGRQREESRAVLARALTALRPGGIVVASAANGEGARSMQADLEQLAGPVTTLTKHKCRVCWTAPWHGPPEPALLEQWRALDAVRPIGTGRFVSRPGLFAWDRIDPASQLLADHLPDDLAGRAADLGCGFGFLAASLLERCADLTMLDLYDAEWRALEVARINVDVPASRAQLEFHWHDVTTGLPHRYDVIVTNPPFHASGRMDRPDIGRRFIAVAADSLHAAGQLWLVANRHLPYEEILAGRFSHVRKVAERDGFKIIAATGAREGA